MDGSFFNIPEWDENSAYDLDDERCPMWAHITKEQIENLDEFNLSDWIR